MVFNILLKPIYHCCVGYDMQKKTVLPIKVDIPFDPHENPSQ